MGQWKASSIIKGANDDIPGREWFKRAWVFQEIIVSREPRICCAGDYVAWRRFCDCFEQEAMLSNGESFTILDPILHYMSHTRSIYLKSRRDESSKCSNYIELLELLFDRRGCAASDPRDIVFSLLGIIPEDEGANYRIQIDYGKTCGEVFNDVVH